MAKKKTKANRGSLSKRDVEVKKVLACAFDAAHEASELDELARAPRLLGYTERNFGAFVRAAKRFSSKLKDPLIAGFRAATDYPATLDGTYHFSFFEAVRAIVWHREPVLQKLYGDDEYYDILGDIGSEGEDVPVPGQLKGLDDFLSGEIDLPYMAVFEDYLDYLIHYGEQPAFRSDEVDPFFRPSHGPFNLDRTCMELLKEAERAVGSPILEAEYLRDYDRYVVRGLNKLDDQPKPRAPHVKRARELYEGGATHAQVVERLGITASNARQIKSRSVPKS